MSITKDKLLNLITNAAKEAGQSYLIYEKFRELSGVPMSQIHRHFDSWTDACKAAAIQPGQANLIANYSKGKMHALRELKRVADVLGVSRLSRSQFNSQNPEVKAATVASLWGGWINALKAAKLDVHPNYHEEISLDALSQEFLKVTSELCRIPTVAQLSRRSAHCKNTFTRKFGSYTSFKRKIIIYLLKQDKISGEIRALFEKHLADIGLTDSKSSTTSPIMPHEQGHHLGFRAFAFAPTYETEVVSIFGAVAGELGFEIVAQREAFPDCEARRLTDFRRRRYRKCLIEFELKSSDFRRHGHPADGCDLIVCWTHDWKDCPLDVLELSSEIKNLEGWR
jgi:hypothetical protein